MAILVNYNLVEMAEDFSRMINYDRKNGRTHNWYYWNFRMQDVFVIDTKVEFLSAEKTYTDAGYEYVKSIPMTESHKRMFGIKDGELLIYRNPTLFNGDHSDPLSLIFGYLAADTEFVILKINHKSK